MSKFILAVALFCLTGVAVAQDCANPLTTTAFQTWFNQVAAQSTPQKKLDQSLLLANNNCMTSAQIKNVATLLADDASRLEFGKAAWGHTFDRVNFFDVYDAFTSLSSALRLYDFTKGGAGAMPVVPPTMPVTPQTQPAQPKPVLKFANIVYPASARYTGKKGCDGPVTDETSFAMVAEQVFIQPTDESKSVAIQTASDQRCFSLAQLMKLTSLIGDEPTRLRTLTNSFQNVFDLDHYPSARALFTTAGLQNEWNQFATATLSPTPAGPAPCVVAEPEMKDVLRTLQSKNFPNEKLAVLETIKNDKCFNVAQVRTLSKEFTFDNNKLDALKMLFAKCPEQSEYYKLADELSFAYLRDELLQFIRNGGK